MYKSPVSRKRPKIAQDEVTTQRKILEDRTNKDAQIIPRVKRRRSRGPRDLASLKMTFREEDYAQTSLSADGEGSYLAGESLPRTDPQSFWRRSHKRALEAANRSWEEYCEWKKSKYVQVCTKTGAILSLKWDLSEAGPSGPLSKGSAKLRKFAIEFLLVEQFGLPIEEEWGQFHPKPSLPTLIMGMLNIRYT